ncbi:MAG: hypothetical protein WBB29_05825 [Geitlerinemataceae cyanobacterium]
MSSLEQLTEYALSLQAVTPAHGLALSLSPLFLVPVLSSMDIGLSKT